MYVPRSRRFILFGFSALITDPKVWRRTVPPWRVRGGAQMLAAQVSGRLGRDTLVLSRWRLVHHLAWCYQHLWYLVQLNVDLKRYSGPTRYFSPHDNALKNQQRRHRVTPFPRWKEVCPCVLGGPRMIWSPLSVFGHFQPLFIAM